MPAATGDFIYLDHAATTPVDPDVLAVMLPYFTDRFGNPSSFYHQGQESRAALDHARSQAARVLECNPGEIVFTSGATESDNLALRGVAWGARLARRGISPRPHIVTTEIEHHAVLHTAFALERQGFSLSFVQADRQGIVDPGAVAAALRPETCLVSVMYANNESGAIQPLRDIAAIARERGILFHTDAVQAAGMATLHVDDLGVDLLSLSAHKFYGPKGVGLLYVRQGTVVDFHQQGGGQEQGRRGGTENVPGIVGLGAALDRADDQMFDYRRHCATLRDRLWSGILKSVPHVTVNGPLVPELRLPNNLNLSISGVEGETMLLSLDMHGVAASTGSACTTGSTEPSHVLRAMGLSDDACRSALRFTVGRGNTEAQIDATIDAIVESVARARSLAPTTV
ncbi:MAG: cysteine desulfurase [Gemmatimonadota bacterium]|nr:cysteine desulfurase [Gemmatimonadota bacterium]